MTDLELARNSAYAEWESELRAMALEVGKEAAALAYLHEARILPFQNRMYETRSALAVERATFALTAPGAALAASRGKDALELLPLLLEELRKVRSYLSGSGLHLKHDAGASVARAIAWMEAV